MNIVKTSISIAILFFCITAGYSQNNARTDSIESQQLDEVVVEATMQRASAKSTTYIPTSSAKESAQNATDLLSRMAIPQIQVDPASLAVSTTTGQSVSIFINYVLATDPDIKGLRTSDVKRVEYLDYPTDPRFRGVEHAINIIVHEYAYGGYTKISDNQFFSSGTSNQGSIFSKFVYKRMTYDLFVETDAVETKHVGSSEYSIYRLPEAVINRDKVLTSSDFKYTNFPASLRLTYNNDKVQIINTFGYSIHNRYTNLQKGSLSFSSTISATDYDYETNAPKVERSASWNGQYYFALPNRWNLAIYPSFIYGHNNSYSDYTTSIPNESPIINNARENVYNSDLSANLVKGINNFNTIKFALDGGSNINKLSYMGSSPFTSKFTNTFATLALGYTFSYNKVNVDAEVGYAMEFTRTNGLKYDDDYPFARISLSWAPNQKNQFNLNTQYATETPGIEQRSPNAIQINELLYKTGNPLLKNSRNVTVIGNYTFLPCNKFAMNAYAYYLGKYKRAVNVYETHNNSLMKTYINDGNYNYAGIGIKGVLRLLNDKLILDASPQLLYMTSTGYIDMEHTPFSVGFHGQYYLGSFNFSALYYTRTHSMDADTRTYITYPSFYQISVGWSNKDWSLQFNAMNFARTKYESSHTELCTPLYTNSTIALNGNYRIAFSLCATYTFGYGKKLQRGNELGAQEGAASAIME